jgi:tryptophan synthase alpha chain
VSAPLGATLDAARDAHRRLLVVYLMGGSTPGWLETAAAVVAAGADAIEIGIAFSDPVLDGPVIQAAAQRALEAGATLPAVAAMLGGTELGVPLIAMTYANVVAAHGYARTAGHLQAAGVCGAILPDLPLEELDAWHDAARPRGIETVLLAAPTTSPARLARIGEASEGFCYAVGRMATTGERAALDPRGADLVRALRAVTRLPILLGIGVSSPEQAREACAEADGVVVGSAVVRRMLDGQAPEEVGAFVASLRAAIDAPS